MRRTPSVMAVGARSSMLWLLMMAMLTSITVFSTTYRIGGVFIYPRAFMAIAGFVLAARMGRLGQLAKPLSLLVTIIILAAVSSLGSWEWSELPSFLVPLLRGVVFPYFAVFALFVWFGALHRSDSAERVHEATRIVCLAVLIQAAVAIAHLSMPAFRTVYLEWVNLAETWREMASLGLPRFSGIGGLSIYDTAISYCVLGAALLLSQPNTAADAWLRALTLAVIVLLCVLHGRSGLVFAAVLWVIVALQEVRAPPPVRSVALRGAVVMVILSALAIVFVDEELRTFLLEFAGEIFVNLASGNGFRSDSTDEFLDNYLRLPDWEAIIGGTGQWAQPDIADAMGRTYSTDSGYLLLLNFGGAPLMLATVFVLWRLACRYAGAIGGVPSGRSKRAPAFIGFLVVVFGLMTWKGPLFLSEHCMTSLFLVLALRGMHHAPVSRRAA